MRSNNKYKAIVFFAFIISFYSISFTQEAEYKVSDIPDVLKKNAKAVIRKNEVEIIVKSSKGAVMNVTFAITVLNENGIDNCYFVQYYDKFIKVNSIKAIVYDANGKKIRRIPGDEIIDHSAISGYSIYEDNRVKLIDPRVRTVPFTFEYSFSINFNGLLHFPEWSYYDDYNVSVESESMKVVVPKSYKFRYLERNLTKNDLCKLENDENTTYFWKAENLPALKEEPYSLPLEEYTPVVYMAPSDFEINNYSGNCETWKNFGIWIKQLNKDRDDLPIETQKQVKELVKDMENDFDKIQAIYSYLQNKTRYVSIQVGIGGWQPFEASVVDKMSYGDCKALTNYMKSLLDVVGIKSNYCLVRAGADASNMIKDFSSTQFNHAFLCIPAKEDTVWLECTSQILPCGYIGTFTDDRDVLLIDVDGGKVVHTKVYSAEDNVKSSKIFVDLYNDGNAAVNASIKYKGLFYDDIIRLILSDDADKKKQLYNRIKISNFELINFSHEVIKDQIPLVKENLDLLVRNLGTFMGDRMMLNLNLMNKKSEIPKRISDRKSDIFIRRSRTEIDTIVYKIPALFTVNKVPSPIEISSKFGVYKMQAELADNKLYYIRSFTVDKGIYPATDYEKFVTFYESILNEDLTKIILTKK